MATDTKVSGGDQPGDEPEIEVIEEAPGQSPGPQDGDGQPLIDNRQAVADEDDDEPGESRTGQRPGQGGGQADGEQQVTQEELTARQRRRRAQQAARDRERQELARLRQENAQLRQNQGRFDQRLAHVERNTVEGDIATVEGEIARTDQIIARAITAQNGDDVVAAQQIRDTLRDRLSDLKRQKAAQEDQGRQRTDGQQVTGAGGPTPQQQRFAGIFMSRHQWVNPTGGDPDSDRVVAIDNQMTREGQNPSTPEYWIELERRIQEELPHHFQRAANGNGGSNGGGGAPNGANGSREVGGANGRRPGGPKLPGNGSGSGGGSGGKVTFHLSPERKQALVDMGVYDNPEERMKYIKRYIRWDAENATKK